MKWRNNKMTKWHLTVSLNSAFVSLNSTQVNLNTVMYQKLALNNYIGLTLTDTRIPH